MPSPDPTHDRYLEPYRRSASRHGSSFEVTLWASPASQRLRFDVFTQVSALAGKRILDAGCSRGDFAAFLVERGVAFKHYVGIDALCGVVEFASRRGLANCEFRCGDFVADPALLAAARADVVCISGTLNTMSDAEVGRVLDAAWDAAGEALLFNFLSDRCGAEAPPQDDFARRLDALRLLDWALSKTWAVAFRQDYFRAGHDATIMMRKT
jgi:SAM-dependent methyltransferase